MSGFNISERDKVARQFYQYFGISFTGYYDGLLSVLNKSIKIDLLKFDDLLHNRFGEYENKDLSMKDVIIQNYGNYACEFIQKLF